MALEVREAQLPDTPAICRLLLELGYDATETVVRRRLERVLGATDHVIFLATERPHGPIGLVHASVGITLLKPPHVTVEALTVRALHRQSGAGRALLERVHNWALRRGIDEVSAQFKRHRKAGHAFFCKMGYTATGEPRVYQRDLGRPLHNQEDITATD